MLLDRVTAAEKALNGTKGVGGFIDKEEAREMINKGMIELDPHKEIKEIVIPSTTPPFPRDPKPANPKPPSKPNIKKESKSPTTKTLSNEELAMIIRCKEAEKKLIEKEKELGKKILKEQEKKDNADSGS